MSSKRAILLFIPGNPGIETYYTAFFSSLRQICPDVDILCSPHIGFAQDDVKKSSSTQVHLDAQIAHKVDLLEGIVLGLKSEESKIPIYVAGHSVGAYMAIKLLALRPGIVQRAYLLFPTISHIAKSPQGVIATSALSIPGTIPLLTGLTWIMSNCLLQRWKYGLVKWFTKFPEDAVQVTADRVLTPKAVHSALTLARSEMSDIKDPDAQFWQQFATRCSAYWASEDNWVSNAHRNELLGIAEGMESYHCGTAPHAFCIRHGDIVATKVGEWLRRDIDKYHKEHR